MNRFLLTTATTRPSTEDHQDEHASRGWQLRRATQLIEPHGHVIVEEFFDIGQSQSIPWPRRPASTRLLVAAADPNTGWEALVIGEPHRAFYGDQFQNTFPDPAPPRRAVVGP